MLTKFDGDTLQSGNWAIHHDIEEVDVGDISDRYASHAESQAVHDIYELGNEIAAEKNEPLFDNRTGFIDTSLPTGGGFQMGMFDAEGSGRQANLNNASHSPPDEVKKQLRRAEKESDALDSAERTNDSTIDPNKPKQDILKGFHGG